MSTLPATPEAFIDHWQKAEANERANSQAFLLGLAHLLGVPAPSNNHAEGYSFEYPVKVLGGSSTNFIDLYRRGHFIFESKQFAARREELSTLEAAPHLDAARRARSRQGQRRCHPRDRRQTLGK